MKINLLFFAAAVFLFFACENTSTEQKGEPATTYGCEVSKSQLLGVDSLIADMQAINAWGKTESFDSIAELNGAITAKLQELLSCAAAEQLDLAGAFENLGYAQTQDGRIRNFNWYANNGGTWYEMRSIYQYYPKPHEAKTTEVDYFAGANRFYRLKAEQPMYLGFGFDRTCSTCGADYALLFSFEADTLNIQNVLSIESRLGDLLRFEFDTVSQTLHFAVALDDMNQDWAAGFTKYKFSDLDIELDDAHEGWQPETGAEVVVDSLVFDGEGFGGE